MDLSAPGRIYPPFRAIVLPLSVHCLSGLRVRIRIPTDRALGRHNLRMMPLPLFPFVFLCLPLFVSCVPSMQIAVLLLMNLFVVC